MAAWLLLPKHIYTNIHSLIQQIHSCVLVECQLDGCCVMSAQILLWRPVWPVGIPTAWPASGLTTLTQIWRDTSYRTFRIRASVNSTRDSWSSTAGPTNQQSAHAVYLKITMDMTSWSRWAHIQIRCGLFVIIPRLGWVFYCDTCFRTSINFDICTPMKQFQVFDCIMLAYKFAKLVLKFKWTVSLWERVTN